MGCVERHPQSGLKALRAVLTHLLLPKRMAGAYSDGIRTPPPPRLATSACFFASFSKKNPVVKLPFVKGATLGSLCPSGIAPRCPVPGL